MRKLRTAVLTGIATLAVAGVGYAAIRDMHVMKVDLPDGSVARIEYKGDVAPKVTVAPTSAIVPARFGDLFDDAPFSALDRITAEMDRRARAMLQEANALQASPLFGDGKPDLAVLSKLPAGTFHYQFVSTSDRSGVCNRSLEVRSYGPAQKPEVVSTSSAACSPAGSPAAAASAAPESRASAPEMRKAAADPAPSQARATAA